MNLLTPDELSQVQLIVENAHREGWIRADAELATDPRESSVRVIVTLGTNIVEKAYTRDDRWPFLLLRDLAWGSFRTWSTQRPV